MSQHSPATPSALYLRVDPQPLTFGASQPVLVDCQSVLQLWPIPTPDEFVMDVGTRDDRISDH